MIEYGPVLAPFRKTTMLVMPEPLTGPGVPAVKPDGTVLRLKVTVPPKLFTEPTVIVAVADNAGYVIVAPAEANVKSGADPAGPALMVCPFDLVPPAPFCIDTE